VHLVKRAIVWNVPLPALCKVAASPPNECRLVAPHAAASAAIFQFQFSASIAASK
jgi:hypothetical protein